MPYELAKELKEVGFRQPPGGFIYIPTLEELIEACGEMFGELERTTDGWWKASDKDYEEVRTICTQCIKLTLIFEYPASSRPTVAPSSAKVLNGARIERGISSSLSCWRM